MADPETLIPLPLRLVEYLEHVALEDNRVGAVMEIRDAVEDVCGTKIDTLGPGRYALLECGHAQIIWDNHPCPKIGDQVECSRPRCTYAKWYPRVIALIAGDRPLRW
jgi:hypothetical protein